jgi:hypothetical protein
MAPRTSNTKRTRSNSTPKKAAPKKSRVRKTTVDNSDRWDVYWVRLRNGDEFVSLAHVGSDGLYLVDPTMISYVDGVMILAPYGLMTPEKNFFFPAESVLHFNEVIGPIADLYHGSLLLSSDYTAVAFEKLIGRSIEMVRRSLESRAMKEVPEGKPTPTDLERAEAEMSELLGNPPEEFVDAVNDKPRGRSRSQTIDDLVKLAEAAGKGKKPVA